MRIRTLFGLVIIVALVLAACGPTAAPEPTSAPAAEPTEAAAEEATEAPKPEEPAEGVELRFTYYADGKEADVMQPILDKVMAENPDITVVLDVVP